MAPSLAQARRALSAVIDVATRRINRFTADAVSSRLLQQTVIATTLLATAGVLLYILAALGYLFLYYKYLPELVTTVPVHLQYGVGPNPFGIASLEGIANRQPYDITVSLSLPRSPANLDRGNFMIALHLLSPVPTAGSTKPQTGSGLALPYLPPANPRPDTSSSTSSSSSWHSLDTLLQPTRLDLPSFLASHTIVHTTTRPALIPYVDPFASQATRILLLFYHMLSPRAAATVHLDVPMAEGLSFPSRRRRPDSAAPPLPESLLLEVQAGQGIQVYDARVTLVARLKGLRGLMYRWKITAFVVITGAFWAGSMAMLACVFVIVGVKLGDGWEGGGGVKDSERDSEQASDDEGGRGGGGRYTKRERAEDGERRSKAGISPSSASDRGEAAEKSVKKEEEGSEGDVMARVPQFETGHSTEADDEAESEPGKPKKWKGKEKEVKVEEVGAESEDSGVGTSYSGQASKEGIRRRNTPA
ncbi:hypothetical protein L209DRAFT_753257 [Thermothelomyces heterothallicus CBS 203.75]